MADGAFIFLAVVIVIIIGIVISSYSGKRSGITAHPTDGRGAAPGAEGRSEPDHDQGEQTPADFGTK